MQYTRTVGEVIIISKECPGVEESVARVVLEERKVGTQGELSERKECEGEKERTHGCSTRYSGSLLQDFSEAIPEER